MFDEHESAYLRSQRLARLATVDAEGQPTVTWSWGLAGSDFDRHGGFRPTRREWP